MPRQTSIYLTDGDQRKIAELCKSYKFKSASELFRHLLKNEWRRYLYYNLSDKQIVNREEVS